MSDVHTHSQRCQLYGSEVSDSRTAVAAASWGGSGVEGKAPTACSQLALGQQEELMHVLASRGTQRWHVAGYTLCTRAALAHPLLMKKSPHIPAPVSLRFKKGKQSALQAIQ